MQPPNTSPDERGGCSICHESHRNAPPHCVNHSFDGRLSAGNWYGQNSRERMITSVRLPSESINAPLPMASMVVPL